MAARIPMIATTIINSISVKPFSFDLNIFNIASFLLGFVEFA
jgi:hypothetical protein